jgi:ferredoxin
MLEIGNFARSVCEKITGDKTPSGWSGNDDPGRLDSADSSDTHPAYREIKVPGNTPPGPYYTPRKVDGEPAVFLKAKPRTDSVKCDMCGKCAEKCPMGSIAAEDPAVVYGICIKCQACVKICPQNAKYFDDPDFLSHKEMLAQNYERRAESVFVL